MNMAIITTDPIADMLTRVRNAAAVNKTEVSMPFSKLKATVAEELVKARFLKGMKTDGEGIAKQLVITINSADRNSAFTEIKRLSKPGRRVYAKADEIPRVKGGRGIVLVSTSQGVMTGKAAQEKRLGGELICSIF
jgi:small subunit ribosomal protein S8